MCTMCLQLRTILKKKTTKKEKEPIFYYQLFINAIYAALFLIWKISFQ